MQFYKEDVETIFEFLKTSKKGLSQAEAAHKLELYGLNKLETKTDINPFKIFIEQFKSFIIYILLVAVILSLVLGENTDAILILIILVANALIGFFQEYSAQKSLEALKKLNIVKTKVYRNNELIEIDSSYLVLGDIIYLEAGDRVPADCRIFEEKRLRVEESTLTGESKTVEKHILRIENDQQMSEQKNMLFSSTTIAQGSARAIVVKIGMKTEIGNITKLIKESKEELTPLQVRLDEFGKKLGFAIILICLLIFFMLIITKGVSLDNISIFALIAVSLAVAAVPTALPAVVTVALSIGVKRLLKRKALVRKLSSVETLGSCNVICTDKTGTLTKNEMTVKHGWTLDSEVLIEGTGYSPWGNISAKINLLLFKTGILCNNASVYKKDNLWQISGDPTEAALVVSAKKANVNKTDKENILDEIPFDSNRKIMSVLVSEKNKLTVYTKGAINHILDKCTHVLLNKNKVKLTDELKKIILNQNRVYALKSMRVLAFAYKDINFERDFTEENLVFIGLQAMSDPPRPEVIESIQKAKDAGIRIIMITGDYKDTAEAIGNEVGISGGVVVGEELEAMSLKQLGEVIKGGTSIFARVTPQHKLKIIEMLQNQGNVVAMTGDGVNDAPALKKANIGIAVGSGTDVAKEAADLVLLDNSFSNIVNTIEEGRGIYDNIQKSIMLLLSGNFGEILIIFFAVILGWNLPLTAVLLLWINLVTDGAPALAFGVDSYDRDIMKRKPVKLTEGILPKSKLIFIGFLGFSGALIGLFIFSIFNGKSLPHSPEHILAQTLVFNFVVLYELLLVFIIRKQYNIKMLSNFWLWSALVLSVVLQVLIMYTPISKVFEITTLNLLHLVILVIAGFVFYLSYVIYSFFQRYFKSSSTL